MAMTKAERAAFEAMRVRAALSWPPPPPAPIDPRDAIASNGPPFRGWWFNSYNAAVGEGVSLGSVHCREPCTDEQIENRHSGRSRLSFSQGAGGPWYATKVDALRALHHHTAKQAAERLAAIERMIEAAEREAAEAKT